MPGLVPGIHDFRRLVKDVDGRDEPGHDKVSFAKSPDSEPLSSCDMNTCGSP
jgi:hypothetical protein